MNYFSLRIPTLLCALAIALFLVATPGIAAVTVFAQDAPAIDTPTPEPTNTPTPVPTHTPTYTPTPTPIPTLASNVVPTPTPVPIPEPVTSILLGTGLAALAGAAIARKRKS